jgi:hypothetical protein
MAASNLRIRDISHDDSVPGPRNTGVHQRETSLFHGPLRTTDKTITTDSAEVDSGLSRSIVRRETDCCP